MPGASARSIFCHKSKMAEPAAELPNSRVICMTPARVFVPDEPGRISMTNVSRRLFLALPAVAAAATLARPAFALSDAQNLVEKSRLAFLDMITDDNYKEMRDYVKQARALIIFPELIKGAFIIGAEGGSGVLVTRGAAGAGWSYPA